MIWNACSGEDHIGQLAGTLYRLVESQEQIATMGYVDTLDEQAVLEELLEQAKPDYPDVMQDYHYLLTTPFRYPPLTWGSRFGRTSEPSLFYAGCTPEVVLAESAFYRFVFLYSIDGITKDDKMRSEHTMFSVDYKTSRGVHLQSAPFNQFQAQLTSPNDYTQTHQLGGDMRASGVKAFEYVSARDPGKGICVGLYDNSAFRQRKPKSKMQWLCETTADKVSFKQLDNSVIAHFALDVFLHDGKLPLPAG